MRDKLHREKQLSTDDAIAIVRATASALDYAHKRGVIHRNIKPERRVGPAGLCDQSLGQGDYP